MMNTMKSFCVNLPVLSVSGKTLAMLLLCSSAQVQSAPQKLPIQVKGDSPFYQLNLPLELISNASRDDLTDIQVLNAKGESLVWSWLHTESRRDDLSQQQAPFFVVSKTRSAAETGVVIDKQGRLQLKTKPVSDASPAYWLLDLSQIKGQLLEANLTLAADTQGVFPVALEFSDDLQHWYSLGQEQTLLQLTHAQQQLTQLSLNLSGQTARYLRLKNLADKSLKIEKIMVSASQTQRKLPQLLWTPELKAERCTDHYCDYLLPPHFAAEKLEIKLAQTNSLARLDVVGVLKQNYQAPARRHVNPLSWLHQHRVQVKADLQAQDQFYLLHQLIAYKLDLAGRVLTTPQLTLDGTNYQRLRLQLSDPQSSRLSLLGSEAPTIRLAMSELSLVFLARGDAPFSLQVGAKAVNPGYSESELLAPVRDLKQQASLALASIDTTSLKLFPASSVDKAKPKAAQTEVAENRKFWLWGVLVLALVLVGGMVWSLLAKNTVKTQDNPGEVQR